MILEKTIRKASLILKNSNIESHELDAEIILSNIMGVTKEFIITNNKISIPKNVIKEYNKAISRRTKREPVAYIIGEKEFWSKSFKVSKSTLVPRPETELLIYKIINFYKNKSINILDIGTGSGCILLSILQEVKNSRGVGIDVSSKAIKIAKFNANKFALNNRTRFKVCDLTKFNEGKYDLIVSNPPYIPIKDIRNLSKDITNFEPKVALKGGIDGLDLIKKVIYKSNYLLKNNGMLAIEVGHQQYRTISSILCQQGFREIGIEYDYNRNIRCIISTKVRFF